MPWLRDMHDATSPVVVGQKAAQMGYSETLLNRVFYEMDINGNSCLYVLPSKTPDATDFSAGRFDPAIEQSTYLKSMFSDVKNVGLKRAGHASLFVRGSRSKSGLKSVPCAFVALDELEEFTQENIPLVKERSSGQYEKYLWMVSTPTIDGRGINKEFMLSTQEEFFFICPHCNRYIDLTFPESVVAPDDPERCHYVCKLCSHPLDEAAKPLYLSTGKWVQARDADSRGFHINQLYSCTISPYELATAYCMSLLSPAAEQEFYNSKLGLPHVTAGAQVTEAALLGCLQAQQPRHDNTKLVTMGVDVGKVLHYEVMQYTNYQPHYPELAHAEQLEVGTTKDFESLDLLMRKYSVNQCVIDANPETRCALQFAQRFYKHVNLCYYNHSLNARDLTISDTTVSANRTSWLDLALSRFTNGTISIMDNTTYREHVKAPVRIVKPDQYGNPFACYDERGLPDHFAHARNYSEIAASVYHLR
jgi:hypothetical protein